MTTPLVNLIYPIKYRTYVEDVVEGEDPKGRRVERGPHDVELQVVVHNLEEVPALASLMHLLKPDKASQCGMSRGAWYVPACRYGWAC